MQKPAKKWLLVCSVFLVGCGGGPITPPQQLQQPEVTSISITPSTVNVAAGQQQQFTATVSGTGNFNKAVTWSVTGDGAIDSNGLFTAGTTSGSATVQVASVANQMVINSAMRTSRDNSGTFEKSGNSDGLFVSDTRQSC